MTDKPFVLQADQVAPFAPAELEGTYASQCVIDKEGAGSERLQLNRCTLRGGKRLAGGSHDEGYDECYYVLSGRAQLALGGDPGTGAGADTYELGPESVVFIPGGTFHALSNPYDEDLLFLTIWPRYPGPGVNPLYDQRIEAWGTSFRMRDES